MIAAREEWNPPDNLEPQWKDFLVGVMSQTVQLCRWLAKRTQPGMSSIQRGRTVNLRRMHCACVAWNWVFNGGKSLLPLEEVCLFLGLRESEVREKILADCQPGPDINQVVEYVIHRMENWHGHPSRKTARPGRLGTVDWAGLRDFRSHHPFGSSFENFRRFAVGSDQDGDSG